MRHAGVNHLDWAVAFYQIIFHAAGGGLLMLRSFRQFARWLTIGFYGVLCLVLIYEFGEWASRREIQALTQANQRTLEVQKLALRGTVNRYQDVPFTIARNVDMVQLLQKPTDRARLSRVNDYLQEVNRRVGADALYLMDANGRTLAASNWNAAISFVGDDYSFRPYFKEARSGSHGFYYAVGSATRVPGLFLSAPVMADGQVMGVIAIKVSLREIEEAWRNGGDPVVLLDARGIVFLGADPSWLYLATQVLNLHDMQWLTQHLPYGKQANFSYVPWKVTRADQNTDYRIQTQFKGRKHDYLANEEWLKDYGWTLVVMSDLGPAAWVRSVAVAIAILVAIVLILGVMYWLQRERRLAQLGFMRQELENRVAERTQELQAAHSFRKAMEDSLLVGMRARDLQGHIIYVNHAMCDMIGYSADELMGRLPPYPYWHPDDTEDHWRANDAALSGRAELTGFEARVRHKQGHDVNTMVYTAPLIGANGQHSGWMSSVVDITAQKKAEEQQRIQVEQIQHAQRKASLGEMASTLAHELNQPLMAMANFASAAKAFSEQNRTALVIENLDAIKEQAQRAKDVMDRIREPARQQTPGFQPCDVNDAIGNVLALLKFEVRQRKARVETSLTSPLPPITADRVLLEQVIMNLIMNALQAMHTMPPVQRVVGVLTGMDGARLVIRVTDRGTGIAPDVAHKLFEPFFTTKKNGLGLGLNICRTIVEGHGGRLVAENGTTGGAVFSVYLPVSE
jgi:two-component system, LuxR family, sensor histidine kinase DctS